MVYLIRVVVTTASGHRRMRYIGQFDEFESLSMRLHFSPMLASLKEDALAFKTREEAESQALLLFSKWPHSNEYEVIEYEALK